MTRRCLRARPLTQECRLPVASWRCHSNDLATAAAGGVNKVNSTDCSCPGPRYGQFRVEHQLIELDHHRRLPAPDPQPRWAILDIPANPNQSAFSGGR